MQVLKNNFKNNKMTISLTPGILPTELVLLDKNKRGQNGKFSTVLIECFTKISVRNSAVDPIAGHTTQFYRRKTGPFRFPDSHLPDCANSS